MASYHCTVRIGKTGKGAVHASYVCREGKYATMTDRAYGEKVEHIEHGNMPKWAKHRPLYFWEQADIRERSNGSVYREFEVALPRELSVDQRIELVREFVRNEIGQSHAYTFAIHNPKAAIEGGEQPHAHIMYSERIQDGIERDPESFFKRANKKTPELGGCTKSDRFTAGARADRRETIIALRKAWADLQNQHLEKYEKADRVDHRTLKEQGKVKAPEKHLGPRRVKMLNTSELDSILKRREAMAEYDRMTHDLFRALGIKETFKKLDPDQFKSRVESQKPEVGYAVLPTAKMPDFVARNYVQNDPGVYARKATEEVAFVDAGRGLKTASDDSETVNAMIAIAKEKGWTMLRLTGEDSFRRAAWVAASLRGLTVEGYEPKPQDLKALTAARAQFALDALAKTKNQPGQSARVDANPAPGAVKTPVFDPDPEQKNRGPRR